MKHVFYIISIGFILLGTIVNAQSSDPGDDIFDNSVLHEVHFDFDQANYWSVMTNNYESTAEGDAVPYLMGKVTIDGEIVDSVGVRFKGFTSYTDANKKPIKIDFNEFVKGKKYDGLKKLNLNNGTGDPGMQRDVVCYDLLRNSGVAAPRTSYSKVFFNGQYWGLYQNIEQVDKSFLKNNFSNGKGNLYKNKGWDSLQWRGDNHNLYHPPYELKTNEEGDDWSGLVNLVDVINNTSDTEFAEQIEEVFNVDVFLKTLAVDVATNNWDSYLEHGRNWYMYEDTTTGIFSWIPWDYNFSLGGGFGGGNDCLVFPQFLAQTNGTNSVEFFNFSFYVGNAEFLWDFGDGTTSTEKEPTHTYTTGGSYPVCLTISLSEDCYNQNCDLVNTTIVTPVCPSITDGSCPHPANGIFLLVVDFIPSCCDIWGEDCEDLYQLVGGYGEGGGGGFTQDFDVNQEDNEKVLINRLLNNDDFNERYYGYFCDLLENQMTEEHLFTLIDHNVALISEAIETDPNFLFSYDDFRNDVGAINDTIGIKSILSKRIEELQLNLEEYYSCSDVVEVPYHDVVINEFMASTDSTSTISDPDGEIEDWIELYNNTDTEIDLSGMFLSDKISDPQSFEFPAGTVIAADGYLIVWADKDEEQEGLHAEFKLKKGGEELILSNADGSVVDSLTFGEQQENIAAARIPNGTGDFVFQEATHNYNNESVGTNEFDKDLSINIYPVPVSDYLEINIQNTTLSNYRISVYSITGRLLHQHVQKTSSYSLDVKGWNDGFYFVQVADKEGNTSNRKFIIRK